MRLLLVSLFSLLSLSFYPAQDPSWRVYSSAEGLFSAAIPEEPKTTVIVTDSTKGRLLTHIVSATDNDRNEYLVSWTQYDRGTSEFKTVAGTFERVRDALVASKQGKILNEPAITMNGHPARAVNFTDSDGHLVQARFYFVQNRFYQVMAETRSREESRAMEKFLDSFKVVETK